MITEKGITMVALAVTIIALIILRKYKLEYKYDNSYSKSTRMSIICTIIYNIIKQKNSIIEKKK